MHLTTTPVLHRVITVNTSRRTSVILAFLLGAVLIGLIIHHALTDELILHSVTFVASVTIIGVRTMQLITTRTPKDSLVQQQIWGMVRFGAGKTKASIYRFHVFSTLTAKAIFELGFLVWLVDGWICGWLRSWRTTIGLPWAFLLELHGWYADSCFLPRVRANNWYETGGISAPELALTYSSR